MPNHTVLRDQLITFLWFINEEGVEGTWFLPYKIHCAQYRFMPQGIGLCYQNIYQFHSLTCAYGEWPPEQLGHYRSWNKLYARINYYFENLISAIFINGNAYVHPALREKKLHFLTIWILCSTILYCITSFKKKMKTSVCHAAYHKIYIFMV